MILYMQVSWIDVEKVDILMSVKQSVKQIHSSSQNNTYCVVSVTGICNNNMHFLCWEFCITHKYLLFIVIGLIWEMEKFMCAAFSS